MDGSYVLLRLCIKHYATVALLVASPLQLVPEHVSALDEKRPDDAHTSQERYTPEVRYNPLVIDLFDLFLLSSHEFKTPKLTESISGPRNIQPIVCHPARQICGRQPIQRLIRQLGHIANHHRRSEEPEVLEPVLLRAFGPDDGRFGRFVDRLV